MRTPTLTILRSTLGAAAILAILIGPASAQRRQGKATKMDFPAAMAAAQKAFEAEQYSAALRALQEATNACLARQREQILAAMPDLPGFTKKPQPKDAGQDDAAAKALGGMFGGLAGMQAIEQEYTKDKQRVTIKVTPSSPLVGMMQMMIANPAMLASQKGQELIEYDDCKAVLDTENESRIKLTVLAGEKSTVEVETRNMTADEVLGVMSQENLTALMVPLKGK